EKIFARHGLRIFDMDQLPTHGGSLRIYAGHQARLLDVKDSAALTAVRAAEQNDGLADLAAYAQFERKVQGVRSDFLSFLSQAKRQNKRVCGYGAAAKGNTFLNFCGASPTDVELVADRSEHKQGKLLPGSHIPIVTPEALMAARPDYVLI